MNDQNTSLPSTVDVEVSPRGFLELLSQGEARSLRKAGKRGDGAVHDLFRACALAVLNCGNDTDDAQALFRQYADFDVQIVQRTRGVKLSITHAPESAFVDGRMIEGIKEHLFAVLRDIVYVSAELGDGGGLDTTTPHGITDAVFQILRNARLLTPGQLPNLMVCWGGHAIGRGEYDYTKEVGYALGLRGLDICTGCGPGAMKGPMKGATIAHAKQRFEGRYIGISEPGIIAAEPPNPIVNQLVVLPDIEKRLEAFVRTAHGIIVFPGGVGTAEEILYLLGILLHPDNAGAQLPVVFTGPESAREYFEQIDAFLVATIGEAARRHYRIIVNDPEEVARHMARAMKKVRRNRVESGDAYYFNWLLNIPPALQEPFDPTHEAMRALPLHHDQLDWELAANLRRAMSGIVAGNVKAEGVRRIEEHGPFEISADPAIMGPMDELLRAFVAQGRMKLDPSQYRPCFKLVG